MELLSLLFTFIGIVVGLVYGIILMVRAFQTSVLWGLGYIFIPFVSLIFVAVHWDVAKKPFLMLLLAIPFLVLGRMLAPEVVVPQVPVAM